MDCGIECLSLVKSKLVYHWLNLILLSLVKSELVDSLPLNMHIGYNQEEDSTELSNLKKMESIYNKHVKRQNVFEGLKNMLFPTRRCLYFVFSFDVFDRGAVGDIWGRGALSGV